MRNNRKVGGEAAIQNFDRKGGVKGRSIGTQASFGTTDESKTTGKSEGKKGGTNIEGLLQKSLETNSKKSMRKKKQPRKKREIQTPAVLEGSKRKKSRPWARGKVKLQFSDTLTQPVTRIEILCELKEGKMSS